MRMGGIPMARLAAFLGGMLGRVVMDETNLAGPFDVDLRWRPDIGLSPDLTEAAKQQIEARPIDVQPLTTNHQHQPPTTNH